MARKLFRIGRSGAPRMQPPLTRKDLQGAIEVPSHRPSRRRRGSLTVRSVKPVQDCGLNATTLFRSAPLPALENLEALSPVLFAPGYRVRLSRPTVLRPSEAARSQNPSTVRACRTRGNAQILIRGHRVEPSSGDESERRHKKTQNYAI